MKLSTFLSIYLVLVLISCNKNKADMTSETETTKIDYKEEGYTAGTIIWDKGASSPCDYLIQTKDGQLLEAMDLPDSVKEDGNRIWFQFVMQRRPASCDRAQPIGIMKLVER